MMKFDLGILKSLCKSMFDHWRKATKIETKIGSNGDGSPLELPRTIDLWEADSAFSHWEMESKTQAEN